MNPNNTLSRDLVIPNLNDLLSKQPVSERKYLSDLTASPEPLKPLPDVNFDEIYIPLKYSQQCSICNTPERIRKQIEYVYNDSNENSQSVRAYLWEYYGVRVDNKTIRHHMHEHCDLRQIQRSGLGVLEAFQSGDSFKIFYGQSYNLAYTMIKQNIDEILGMRPSKDQDLTLKRSARISQLTKELVALEKAKQEALKNIDIIAVLQRITNKIIDAESKQVVIQELLELQRQMDGNL